MALTDAQRSFRAGRIGSSDATRIMAGDWQRLWAEKTGRAEPANLDFVPAVQIGIVTEALHPRFRQRRTGIPSIPADARTYVHPTLPWLVCHPDFLTWSAPPLDPFLPPDTILEAKFCGSPQSDEDLADRYYWQVQQQLMVTGFNQAILSILRPSSYSSVDIPADAEQQEHLLENLTAFWWHVENDIEPGDPLPVPAPDVEGLRVLEMSRHNAFAAHAATLVATRDDMLAYKAAEQELKSLMPDEARIAYVSGIGGGDGLCLSRSRDGRLTLRFGAPARRHMERAEPWRPDGAAAEPAFAADEDEDLPY